MFRCLFFVCSFVLVSLWTNAQDTSGLQSKKPPVEETAEKKKGLDPNRLFFGGYVGAQFGDYTLVNVAPQVGYWINNYFAAGAGINFTYQGYRQEVNNQWVYKSNYGYAGLNVFGRAYPIKYIFAHVQPEINYNWGSTEERLANGETVKYKQDTRWVPVLLLGGGLAVPTGGRAALTVSFLYDVLQDEGSPYGDQVFMSIGFMF
jgi:hypothetical protein